MLDRLWRLYAGVERPCIGRGRRSDTGHMKTLEPHLLHEDPTLLRLLSEYRSALDDAPEAPSALEEDPGPEQEQSGQRWVPRIRSLADVDAAELSTAHGRLIALGLLNFQLEGRTSGLCYRLSPLGRAALESALGAAN